MIKIRTFPLLNMSVPPDSRPVPVLPLSPMNDKKITYKDAGVDIDAGMESLRRIKEEAKSTFSGAVLTGLGSFGSMFDLGEIIREYSEPVLVQSVDGVGTKLMVARMAGRHDSVGVDIVNHCCNDILCQGAKPLTFLDYIAVESLSPEMVAQLVSGMAQACRDTGVSLVGGETAELPGIYMKGEYDLAGIITGVVEKSKILTGSEIRPGDAVLGLASSGLHTNGYTLARKVFFERLGLTVDSAPAELGRTVGEELLEPHRDYSRVLWPLLQSYPIKALAHITGGGLIDNVPRILPETCDAVIEKKSWEVPPVFRMIAESSGAPEEDLYRSLNMGVGMVIVIPAEHADVLSGELQKAGETVWRLGEIEEGIGKTRLT